MSEVKLNHKGTVADNYPNVCLVIDNNENDKICINEANIAGESGEGEPIVAGRQIVFKIPRQLAKQVN